MREQTAREIKEAYLRWRDLHQDGNRGRAAKEDLDELVDQALREIVVEQAYRTLNEPFSFGHGGEWPDRAGLSLSLWIQQQKEINQRLQL